MPVSCDLLLTNAHVLTMDEQFTVHTPGSVAVAGGAILAVGDLGTEYDAAETIDCRGRVVMPGLVNAHTHAPMTLLRGLADDLRLDVWLMGYMMPVERAFVRPDFVALGTTLACAEMIRSGTTCFADMYYFEEAVAGAAAAAGLRALCAQTVLKFPAPDAASFEDSLARAREFIIRWKAHPLIVPGIAPHAPYTCTEEILRACAELAHEFDVPLHTHLAETALEVEQSRRDHGMPVVPWVKKQRLFDARVVAAHCVHVDEGEMRALKDAGAGVAHNPTSNLKLGSGIAPVAKMLELGIAVGIGTDGPASNNDLDMFEETRLAALLAKGIGGDPTALPAREALAMATRLGARAMHLGGITGSLEPGKRADLIVVDLDQAHNVPAVRRDAERGLLSARVRREVDRRRRRDVRRPVADARPAAPHDRRGRRSRGGARRGAAHRRVPDRAGAERAAEADRDRRSGGRGKLRGPGRRRASAPPRRCGRRWPATRLRSSALSTITSTTPTSSSTIPARDACGTARTSSSTSSARWSAPGRG